MAATTTSHYTTNSNSNLDNTITVQVVLQKRRDRWYLYGIGGSRDMSGDTLMAKVQHLYAMEVPAFFSIGGRALSIQKPVIAIGTLSPVSVALSYYPSMWQ
jgi:hypothetical protein